MKLDSLAGIFSLQDYLRKVVIDLIDSRSLTKDAPTEGGGADEPANDESTTEVEK